MSVYNGLCLQIRRVSSCSHHSISEDTPDIYKFAWICCRFTATAASPSSLARSQGFHHGQSKPAPPTKPTSLLFPYAIYIENQYNSTDVKLVKKALFSGVVRAHTRLQSLAVTLISENVMWHFIVVTIML